jgi:hypothetical protein
MNGRRLRAMLFTLRRGDLVTGVGGSFLASN